MLINNGTEINVVIPHRRAIATRGSRLLSGIEVCLNPGSVSRPPAMLFKQKSHISKRYTALDRSQKAEKRPNVLPLDSSSTIVS